MNKIFLIIATKAAVMSLHGELKRHQLHSNFDQRLMRTMMVMMMMSFIQKMKKFFSVSINFGKVRKSRQQILRQKYVNRPKKNSFTSKGNCCLAGVFQRRLLHQYGNFVHTTIPVKTAFHRKMDHSRPFMG